MNVVILHIFRFHPTNIKLITPLKAAYILSKILLTLYSTLDVEIINYAIDIGSQFLLKSAFLLVPVLKSYLNMKIVKTVGNLK